MQQEQTGGFMNENTNELIKQNPSTVGVELHAGSDNQPEIIEKHAKYKPRVPEKNRPAHQTILLFSDKMPSTTSSETQLP